MGKKKNEKTSVAVSRRSLIKWAMATGAALGLPQWKVFEAMEMGAGSALAQEAACRTSNRSVHLVAGGGGLAWYQLLWPHVDVAEARNESFAWHAIGEERRVAGTHKDLVIGPQSPFADLPGERQITCMMAGTNQTHTRRPESSTTLAVGSSLFAACSAVQAADASTVPAITVGNVQYGAADGAPRTSRVGNAEGLVSLFTSAASQSLLRTQANQEVFTSAYHTWQHLRAAADRPGFRHGVSVGRGSVALLGQDLADQLRVTNQDRMNYGYAAVDNERVRELGDGLVVTAKAFKLGLTNSVSLPAMYDDPHGAFNNMGRLRSIAGGLGAMLQGFYDDLNSVNEADCVDSTLADNLVISIHGDTPKTPLARQGWPDGTPGNSSWTYIYSSGLLKSGWFGGIDREGGFAGWNPGTGEDMPGRASAQTSSAAAAAILYAVCKGDLRRLSDFYRGESIRGVITNETV